MSRETPTPKPDSIDNSGTTSLNTPSSSVPFTLGLHALPLRSINRACLSVQVELTSPFERSLVQHTFIHAPSTGAAQYWLTCPTLGFKHWARSRQASALTRERGHVWTQIVNRELLIPQCEIHWLTICVIRLQDHSCFSTTWKYICLVSARHRQRIRCFHCTSESTTKQRIVHRFTHQLHNTNNRYSKWPVMPVVLA